MNVSEAERSDSCSRKATRTRRERDRDRTGRSGDDAKSELSGQQAGVNECRGFAQGWGNVKRNEGGFSKGER